MLSHTALYEAHQKLGAHLIDFSGWEMPLHYGSQIAEHHAVRNKAGIFDVSHMGVVDIKGNDSSRYLRYLLANDLSKLSKNGQAFYTCMLNEKGGVIDDLLVYRLNANEYRIVINSATKAKDYDWLVSHSGQYDILITLRDDLSILAIQGPKTKAITQKILPEATFSEVSALKLFTCIRNNDSLIARTGYTGEEGLEMIVPNEEALRLWQQYIDAGVTPCGLGARDTLRLEAGLNLYGTDMDETTTPLVSNLAWTVSRQDKARDFIGRLALEDQLHLGLTQQLVGVIMKTPGVLRNHQKIFVDGKEQGEITSGGFSPTLGHAIGLARIPIGHYYHSIYVERRGEHMPITIVKPPFVRYGQCVYKEAVYE